MSTISVTPPVLLFIHCKRFVILTLTGILILAGAAEVKGKAPTQEASGEALQAPEQETWQMRVLRLMGEDTEDGAKAAMELLQKKAESGDASARAVVSIQTYLAKDREQRESQDLEQLQDVANAGMLEALEAYIVLNFGMPENKDEMKQLADKAVKYKSVIGVIVQRLPSSNAWNDGLLLLGDSIYSFVEMDEKWIGKKHVGKEVKKRVKSQYPNWAWASLKQGCRPMLTMVGLLLSRAPSDGNSGLWSCEKEGIKYLDAAARQGSFRAMHTFLFIAESVAENYPNRLKEVIQYMNYASLADNFEPPDLDASEKGYYGGQYVESMKEFLNSILGASQDSAVRKAVDEHRKVLSRITDRIYMRADRPEVNDDAWLRKEAENGSPAAVKMLGKQMLEDPEKASEYKETMEKALEHKAWNAAYYLGRLYASGAGGEKDPEKAFEYYCIGRDHAGMRASYAVVHSYLFGIGTKKNVKKARLALRTMLWNALDQCDCDSSVAQIIDGGTLAKMLTAHILLGKDAKK